MKEKWKEREREIEREGKKDTKTVRERKRGEKLVTLVHKNVIHITIGR